MYIQEITPMQSVLAFFVCFLAETAGLFGGGAYVIQPALLAMGIPPHMVVAHDGAATMGASATSYIVYHRNGAIDYRLLGWWGPGLVIGPLAGLAVLSAVPAALLQKIILATAVAGSVAMLLKKRDTGIVAGNLPRRWRTTALASGFMLGFWTGFSGLGTGALSLMILILLFGQTIRQASATKIPFHLVAEAVALTGFLLKGWLVWQLFLPMLAGCMLSGYLKAHIILRVPQKPLKIAFLASVVLITGLALARA
jgi:hypothetical protein